jgi:hypothetical protein
MPPENEIEGVPEISNSQGSVPSWGPVTGTSSKKTYIFLIFTLGVKRDSSKIGGITVEWTYRFYNIKND